MKLIIGSQTESIQTCDACRVTIAPVSPVQGQPPWNRMNFVFGFAAIRSTSSIGFDPWIRACPVWIWKGSPALGAIIGAAMVINMFVAATAGTLIPLALRALKIDPALASSVFITTLTDVFGFLSFLGFGSLVLKYWG